MSEHKVDIYTECLSLKVHSQPWEQKFDTIISYFFSTFFSGGLGSTIQL